MASVLTNAGRAVLTGRISASGNEPKQAAWGTGAGTSGATDTTLFTEANTTNGSTGTRVAGTSTQQTSSVTNDTYQVVATITAAASISITNAGLFDNTTIGSGNLFLKGDFSSIGLSSSDSITFTYKIQFS